MIIGDKFFYLFTFWPLFEEKLGLSDYFNHLTPLDDFKNE
jgi:hypothetical protein